MSEPMPDPAPPPLPTDQTLLLLNEAISLGRRDGMAGQHLDAMCSARDEIERLREALRECADELAAELDARHRFRDTNSYVAQQWERDMDVVRRARALLVPSEKTHG